MVDSRLERWAEVHQYLPADIATMVCGHAHGTFARLASRRLVITPGSVGLPYGRNGAHWTVLSNGAVTLGRTLIDIEHLVREVTAASTMPECAEWAAKNVRHPASDIDAVASFWPRDGRGDLVPNQTDRWSSTRSTEPGRRARRHR